LPKLMYQAMVGMSDTLAREKMKHTQIDVIVKPNFQHVGSYDFDKVNLFVNLGEKAMKQKMGLLRKKLGR